MNKLFCLLVAVITIYSCNLVKKKDEIKNDAFLFDKLFIKDWYSVEDVSPYASILEIKNNNVFEFKYDACIDEGYSVGTWRVDSPYIILNSFTIDTCMYLWEFGVNCIPIPENGEVTEQEKATTVHGCVPLSYDTYISFIEDSFYVQNDTLFHVMISDLFCPDLRNNFIDNYNRP